MMGKFTIQLPNELIDVLPVGMHSLVVIMLLVYLPMKVPKESIDVPPVGMHSLLVIMLLVYLLMKVPKE